jgi:hypothetical protein
MGENKLVRKQSDIFIALLNLKNKIVRINHASKVSIGINKEEDSANNRLSQGLFKDRLCIVKVHGNKIVLSLKQRARLSRYTYLLNVKQKMEVKTYG